MLVFLVSLTTKINIIVPIKPNIAVNVEAKDMEISWPIYPIANGAEEALEITVEGAALGDFVLSSLSIDLTDLSLSGAVTAADTVTLVLSNNSGGSINLGAAVAYCMVIKKP